MHPAPTNLPTTESAFTENVVSIDRVARVVKGGRRFRFRALVVVGDNKGSVGVGVAKGADVQTAITKAVAKAKQEIIDIPLHKGTIPHDTQAKVGGADVLLKPAAPGTGLIAGGVVRMVVEAAGLHNILSKSLGSSNKINNAYATIEALKGLEPANRWVTRRNQTKTVTQTVTKAKA